MQQDAPWNESTFAQQLEVDEAGLQFLSSESFHLPFFFILWPSQECFKLSELWPAEHRADPPFLLLPCIPHCSEGLAHLLLFGPKTGVLLFSGFCSYWVAEKEQALVFRSLTDFCKNIPVEEFLSFHIYLCIFRISQAVFLFLFAVTFFLGLAKLLLFGIFWLKKK